MSGKPFYTFEFQREIIDSLFNHLQNSKKKTLTAERPEVASTVSRSVSGGAGKFRRNSRTPTSRSFKAKASPSCSGSEGIDYVISVHGFKRKNACHLLECCRKSGFIASKNPYEKYRDSPDSHYFRIGPQDLLNMVIDFDEELHQNFMFNDDESTRTLEDWKQQAQELQRRFTFTTKIIKALFLENTAMMSQRHTRQMFSSSGGGSGSTYSGYRDRDSASKGSSKGSSTGDATPDQVSKASSDSVSSESFSPMEVPLRRTSQNKGGGKIVKTISTPSVRQRRAGSSSDGGSCAEDNTEAAEVPSQSREENSPFDIDLSKPQVQTILSIQNEVINSSLDADHFTFGPAEEMAKLTHLAASRERESKHLLPRSSSNSSLGRHGSNTSTDEEKESNEDTGKISWKMMGVFDDDSFDTTESEVTEDKKEKSAKKLKNNLPRFLEEKQKLAKKYPNIKKKYLGEPDRAIVLSLKKQIVKLKMPAHVFVNSDYKAYQNLPEDERQDFEEVFHIEHEFSLFDNTSYKLDLYADMYKNEIYLTNLPHTNWIGKTLDSISPEFVVVSVINVMDSEKFVFITNSKQGFFRTEVFKHEVMHSDVVDKKAFSMKMEAYLDENFGAICKIDKTKSKIIFQQIRDYYSFMEELMEVNARLGIKRKQFSISLLYAKKGQKQPEEFLSNRVHDLSDAAREFFTVMNLSKTIDTSTTDIDKLMDFHGHEFKFNVAPKMDAEQVRRLVGNDNGIVIFVDEGHLFNPCFSASFGAMPQFFLVVQANGEGQYRVGAYQRNAIPTFDPILVKGLISKEDLFDFVVTKCYNGLLKCLTVYPLASLMERPKSHAMAELAEKYKLTNPKRFYYPRHSKK